MGQAWEAGKRPFLSSHLLDCRLFFTPLFSFPLFSFTPEGGRWFEVTGLCVCVFAPSSSTVVPFPQRRQHPRPTGYPGAGQEA